MLVRIANREDPDQTASSEAVWSGSALFGLTFLVATNVRNFRLFTVHVYLSPFRFAVNYSRGRVT